MSMLIAELHIRDKREQERREEQARREEALILREQERREEQARREEALILREQERDNTIRSMSVNFAVFSASLPTQGEGGSITPTQASKEDTRYFLLVERLGLDGEPVIATGIFTQSKQSVNFKWDWSDARTKLAAMSAPVVQSGAAPRSRSSALEEMTYGPLMEYLSTRKLIVEIVDHGQNCRNGNLFDVPYYSRRMLSPDIPGQKVSLRGTIHGLTDLVVLNHAPHRSADGKFKISREDVLCAIEVKTDTYDAKPASREATTQLLGLNINNASYSPPVVLTNLLKHNHVYYIKRNPNTGFPHFIIHVQHCSSFVAALEFVDQLHEHVEVGAVFHFGRPNTPDLIISEGADDEDDEGEED
jgi:hypothetical protein